MDILLIVLLVMVLIMVLLIVFILINQLKYKHKFVIRQLTGTKKFIIEDKWRIWKDKKEGIEYLKLKKIKDTLPLPPANAVEISKSGKFFVEAYRNSEGEYQYIEDKGLPNFFNALTTNQRQILVNQYKKADAKKGWSWKENIPLIAGLSFITIIFISFLLLVGDGIKPLKEWQEARNQDDLVKLETLQIIKEIKQDIQVIKTSNIPVDMPETPPN